MYNPKYLLSNLTATASKLFDTVVNNEDIADFATRLNNDETGTLLYEQMQEPIKTTVELVSFAVLWQALLTSDASGTQAGVDPSRISSFYAEPALGFLRPSTCMVLLEDPVLTAHIADTGEEYYSLSSGRHRVTGIRLFADSIGITEDALMQQNFRVTVRRATRTATRAEQLAGSPTVVNDHVLTAAMVLSANGSRKVDRVESTTFKYSSKGVDTTSEESIASAMVRGTTQGGLSITEGMGLLFVSLGQDSTVDELGNETVFSVLLNLGKYGEIELTPQTLRDIGASFASNLSKIKVADRVYLDSGVSVPKKLPSAFGLDFKDSEAILTIARTAFNEFLESTLAESVTNEFARNASDSGKRLATVYDAECLPSIPVEVKAKSAKSSKGSVMRRRF